MYQSSHSTENKSPHTFKRDNEIYININVKGRCGWCATFQPEALIIDNDNNPITREKPRTGVVTSISCPFFKAVIKPSGSMTKKMQGSGN